MERFALPFLFLFWLTLTAAAQQIPPVGLPLKRLHLTSPFGYRRHPLCGRWALHRGIDLSARHDTVFCILSGRVVRAGRDPGLGLYVRTAHPAAGLEITYGHLSVVMVAPLEEVAAGEALGISGATGKVTGEHLHLAVRFKNQYLDPLRFLYGLLAASEQPERQ